MRYTVILDTEPDGSAVNVTVPAMPGIATWGRTEAEALKSAHEAIELHLEGYVERGQPVSTDCPSKAVGNAVRRVATIEVSMPAGAVSVR